MKAIILAAGKGTRLWKYTDNIPKCMLNFKGKTLIERQIVTLRSNGIDDITIIKGYMAEKINIPGIKYYTNKEYENTNMVYTLFCAEKELFGDVIVAYADVLYESRVLKGLINKKSDVAVVVDTNWQKYWILRYGNINTDTESLVLNSKGQILELGQSNAKKEKINGRYVGLIKFSSNGMEKTKKIYKELKLNFWNKPWQRNQLFQKAYMTDLLNYLISAKIKVDAMKIKNGWLEFDTNEDYEKIIELDRKHELEGLFVINR